MSKYVEEWRTDNLEDDVIHVSFDDMSLSYNLRQRGDSACLRTRLGKCLFNVGPLELETAPIKWLLDEAVKNKPAVWPVVNKELE